MKYTLHPGQITFSDLNLLLDETTQIELAKEAKASIQASAQMVHQVIAENKIVYGINTGFGALAKQRIHSDDLETLQRSLIVSHAAGTGELLSDQAVRLILALKINSLARGYSGVTERTIEALIQLFNNNIYPCVPAQGSVGASGDLAPLAHLSMILLGEGEARYKGHIISAKEALAKINLQPIKLAPKEGLALLNGTQVSTALALLGLLAIEKIFGAALTAGALSVDA